MEKRPWENYEHWEGGCQDGGWWNEALHGVARAGLATAFPQCIGLGSTWNPDLIQKMTDVASTEARIHNQVYGKKLTYWSPTINILRDPRWGRTEESYSEDPYLLSRMAVAFVKGFQGDHPKYLKAVATLKHFVANNSEYNRHNGSSDVSDLYAFQAGITEGGAYSVMSAYNAINGVPASANKWLLDDVLRGEWGFKGYVVSDCGAVSDIVHGHQYETDPEKAVALAAKAGTDLECETCETEQFLYDKYLLNAVKKGYISEKDIDKNVFRLFRARFLLGEFDPPQNVPYNSIPKSKLDCKEHRELALQIAKESIVLLKNDGRTLPLDRNKIENIAVIGPNADRTVLGGYSGSPSVSITSLQGLKDKLRGKVKVHYSEGCKVMDKEEVDWDEENDRPVWKMLDERKSMNDAAELAGRCDWAIVPN
ncbi:MAG: glycoside hydrolase family 3 protein [Planctomycetota bacterium]|jgi:beta-glucosidase